MKKILAMACMAALMLSFPIFPVTASAETSATELIYIVEFTDATIYAPAQMQENERYTASLFAYEDTLYETPLTTNFHDEGYTFVECGSYRVVYFVENIVSEEMQQKTAILKIEDTTAPTITLFDVFAEYVEVGETITLPSAEAKDLSDAELYVDVKVFLNNSEIELNKNHSFVVKDEGIYSVVYTAEDSYGNETVKNFSFISVTPKSENVSDGDNIQGGCVGNVGNVGIVATLLSGMIALIRRKKNEKI